MEIIGLLWNGILQAAAPNILAGTFLGIIVGLLIGALPGLGPTAGVAIMLPLAVGLGGTAAIACLAGVYYGSMFGGAIPRSCSAFPVTRPRL